jgi:acyl-CoA synthetase (NDP forming)
MGMEKLKEPEFHLLFNPRSIALFGASNHIQKWGAIIFLNILLGGYTGKLYPVNPREDEIFGHKSFPTASQIPGPVDLAVIVIPAQAVREAVRDCVQKGIRMAVVITADFSETGEEGARLEKEMIEIARAGGMRLVGPNTMGIFSASCSLTALMPPVRPKKGSVSLVSQSGNIGTQMLAWGEEFQVGFGKYVSSGNEGDLRSEDYLSFFAKDPETKVILTYIEGLHDGRRFFDIAREITPSKPIIAFKGGKTSAGARAAKSHSGAMAGLRELFDATFRQAGIIGASTTDEMLELAAAFSSLPLPQGNRVAILTRGGGWGVVTADACLEAGLAVPMLEEPVLAALDKILPPYWSKGNPVDMVATHTMEPYMECLEILMSAEKIDAVISLSGNLGPLPGILAEMEKRGEEMISQEIRQEIEAGLVAAEKLISNGVEELMKTHRKPIFAVGSNLFRTGDALRGNPAYPQFHTPERAARAAGLLYQYSHFRSIRRSERIQHPGARIQREG